MSQAAEIEMRDSWTIRPPIDPQNKRATITTREWAAEYGLIPRLLPFDQRTHDPIELLRGIQKAFDEMAPTAAVVRLGTITDKLPYEPMTLSGIEPIMEVAGSWAYDGQDNNQSQQWVNPNYVHLKELEPSVTDRQERREILRRCSRYGALSGPDIAPRFGLKKESLQRTFARLDVPWSEWRRVGVKRMARTCHTISHWGDWSEVDLAEAVGASGLKRWIHDHARTTDFEVPPDPSGEPWFSSSTFNGGVDP